LDIGLRIADFAMLSIRIPKSQIETSSPKHPGLSGGVAERSLKKFLSNSDF
jgi:hypothetical protein